jgi:hypothetical protein
MQRASSSLITKKQKMLKKTKHQASDRSMANTYQRNKQDFSYRNGCAKEISKKIKVRKNKK